MILALDFVKIEDIENGLTLLSEELLEDLRPLLDWFEYIGIVHRNRF